MARAIHLLRPLHHVNRVPLPAPVARRLKHRAEYWFWRVELERYVRWYEGEELRGEPPPGRDERVTGHDTRTDAALTYLRVHQRRYVEDLSLDDGALRGMRVLDVGCGPFPCLVAAEGCEAHGLDPLVERYRAAGFPLDDFERLGYRYHRGFAEDMPFEDASFDAVVSANAIDHVDDFAATAREIRRVLRPGGLLRIRVNYHPRTLTEPVVLDDAAFRDHFAWADGLERLREERRESPPYGAEVLWGAGG